jgi:flagellar hook protein FlgE
MGDFKTCLNGVELDELPAKVDQGKAFPGTSSSNVFIEGNGFFVTKRPDGKVLYTRLGEFTFDGEGVYKSPDGYSVQGYILNDKGEVMTSPVPQITNPHTETDINGGPAMAGTTDIKLWIDPSNGKYLGKYDEYEIKEDGILYGKSDKGKIKTPLYKIALYNFHNPNALTRIKENYYAENKESGKPVLGKAEIRSGLIEMSNADFRTNIAFLQQAKFQLEMTNKLINTNKQLLEEALKLLQ